MQADVNAADANASALIRTMAAALEGGDWSDYIVLLKQLSATLQTERLLTMITRGSYRINIARLSPAQRVQLLNLAERWGSATETIHRIVAFSSALEPDRAAEMAAAAHRLKFRKSVVGERLAGIKLVAVGAQCLAWTLPNRWGLRPESRITELYSPLSLASHKIDFLAGQVERDFEDYAPVGKLREVASSNGFQLVGRRDGGALWNHHVGSFWSEHEFGRFRRNVTTGLDRLRATAFGSQAEPVVFLLHLGNGKSHAHRQDVSGRMGEALAKRNADARLILIDTSQHLEPGVGIGERDGKVTSIVAGQPAPDYRWPMAQYYNSANGLAYEERIASAIIDEVEQRFEQHRSAA